MAFMPQLPLITVLLVLGAVGLGLVGVVALVHALFAGAWDRARWSCLALAGVGVGYLCILLLVSLTSEGVLLEPGQWKYFCEIDCHVAYTVVEVERTETLDSAAGPVRADGAFWIVTLRSWFDPRTTGQGRGDFALRPNRRSYVLHDARGDAYQTSLDGMRALRRSAERLVPLTQPLRPGESYETTLVFDLPADVRQPRLLLTDAAPETLLLVGHENSLLHKKIWFLLEPGT